RPLAECGTVCPTSAQTKAGPRSNAAPLPASRFALPLFHCAFGSRNPAVLQLDSPVAEFGIFLGVRHLDDRRAAVIELLEQLHDLATLARVQVARGLVGEH